LSGDSYTLAPQTWITNVTKVISSTFQPSRAQATADWLTNRLAKPGGVLTG
jgi:hypothetical protein